MKEIGGYLGLETFSGLEFYHNLIGVNSGRNALLYILKARNIRKLYIPRFLCDSVRELCNREGYCFEEYPVDHHFLPVFEGTLKPGEYLYIVNFYGQLTNDQIMAMKVQWGKIILDNVQAFFHKPIPGVDTVYSCRKFFGVPDGGYVACEGAELSLDSDISKDRMKHILGRFEESGSAYYADFRTNDELFYDLPLRRMSFLTQNILRAVDYDAVRRKRNDNYARLAEALGGRNRLELHAPDGPYCYPFYCEKGMELKRKLAAEKIYVATLWPNVLAYEETLEKDYAENILPLPCDQRYGVEDMDRVLDVINRYI